METGELITKKHKEFFCKNDDDGTVETGALCSRDCCLRGGGGEELWPPPPPPPPRNCGSLEGMFAYTNREGDWSGLNPLQVKND
jgi:hypothetical protein